MMLIPVEKLNSHRSLAVKDPIKGEVTNGKKFRLYYLQYKRFFIKNLTLFFKLIFLFLLKFALNKFIKY